MAESLKRFINKHFFTQEHFVQCSSYPVERNNQWIVNRRCQSNFKLVRTFAFFQHFSCKIGGKQGCQMVVFQTKNPNLGKFWRG
jgi:hypothetical protein